ncbi:MAG TPA: hypothetical protein VG146_09095 [Verrucomicrobiae bacterium]|nr:hypothetical protein [Verrucomicrobiae bacterium]
MRTYWSFALCNSPVVTGRRGATLAVGLIALAVLSAFLLSSAWMHEPGPGPRNKPITLRQGLEPNQRLTAFVDPNNKSKALLMFSELTGREPLPAQKGAAQWLDEFSDGRLTRWHLLKRASKADSGIEYHRDGQLSAGELLNQLTELFRSEGLQPAAVGSKYFKLIPLPASTTRT